MKTLQEVDTIMLFLQMRKLRLKEVKSIAKNYMGTKVVVELGSEQIPCNSNVHVPSTTLLRQAWHTAETQQ